MLFSKKGLFQTKKDIVIYDDAPEEFRMGLFLLIKKCGIKPKNIRELMRGIFLRRLDAFSVNYSNIWEELEAIIFECEWYSVYDMCEESYKYIYSDIRAEFSNEVNNLFRRYGIGWKFQGGKIVSRECDEIEAHIEKTASSLNISNPALQALNNAKRDLNRRPVADLHGACEHAIAALECMARQITGKEKNNLKTLIKTHAQELDIPKHLDTALEKLWEYALENAKRLKKSRKKTRNEVDLFLGITSTMLTYLYVQEKTRKKK